MKKILFIALLSSTYSFSQCFVKVVSGDEHTIAISDDGTLWGWGSNITGEAGIESSFPNNVDVPTQIGTATNWIDIDCGYAHSMALNSDNELYTWGYNINGQLGVGDYEIRKEPTLAAMDVAVIGAGYFHSFAITTNGSLLGCGKGGNGQLGDNTAASYNTFVNVASGNDWKDVAGGNGFAIALKTNGTMFSTGNNSNGQLGDGTLVSRNYWGAAGTLISNWDEVDAGGVFAYGLTTQGILHGWGSSSIGSLGLGDWVQQVDPQPIAINVVGFACAYSSGIWMTDLAVFTTGSNNYLQTMPSVQNATNTPYEWTQFTSPELVAMGRYSSTLVDDEKTYTWGKNDRGICGNGNTINVTSPTSIIDCGLSTAGIENTESVVMSIFPNPSNDIIRVELSVPSMIKVTDINGKELITSELNNFHQLNLINLESGIYFITTEKGIAKRFVKK